jgi:hypothetical protein
MAQRLSLALVFAFGASRPGVQALVLATLCVIFAVLSAVMAPLRDNLAQALHTVLLLGLTVVAVCGVPFASDQEDAVAGRGHGTTLAVQQATEGMAVVFGTVGPAVSTTLAVIGPKLWTALRLWRQRV